MKINKLLFVAATAAVLTTSCVSTQKYKDMETARDHFKAEYENLRVTSKENEDLKSKLRMAESQIMQAKNSMEQQQTELSILKNYNADLAARYEEAAKENSKLLTQYSTDKIAYEAKVAKSLEELRRKQLQLEGLEGAIGEQNSSLENMRVDLMTREQRVAELERLVAEKQAQMDDLRTSLGQAHVLVGLGGQLLAKLAPLLAQLLQLRDGLLDLRLEGGKLRIHARSLLENHFPVNA